MRVVIDTSFARVQAIFLKQYVYEKGQFIFFDKSISQGKCIQIFKDDKVFDIFPTVSEAVRLNLIDNDPK